MLVTGLTIATIADRKHITVIKIKERSGNLSMRVLRNDVLNSCPLLSAYPSHAIRAQISLLSKQG